MKLTISIDVDTELFTAVLETADYHCGSWVQVTTFSGEDINYNELLTEGWVEYATVDDCTSKVEKRYLLNRKSIIRGIKVLAEKYPRHFSDIMSDNHDITTAYVFLQCCLLGEVVYV